MASLDKLLGKIEKAQSAIKSFKGTVSKFKNLNFNSLVDELAEQKGLANSILDARRSSLQKIHPNVHVKVYLMRTLRILCIHKTWIFMKII
jgi:hypothetical protein